MSELTDNRYTIDDLRHARYRVLQAWRDLESWRAIYRHTSGDGIPLAHVASATEEQRRELQMALDDLARISAQVTR